MLGLVDHEEARTEHENSAGNAMEGSVEEIRRWNQAGHLEIGMIELMQPDILDTGRSDSKFEDLEVYTLMNWMTKHPRFLILAVYHYLDGRQPCHHDLVDQTWIMSHKLQKQKRKGHTRNLWKLITRIFDLDAFSIERVRIHRLAVNIIRPINWTIAVDYYIPRVV